MMILRNEMFNDYVKEIKPTFDGIGTHIVTTKNINEAKQFTMREAFQTLFNNSILKNYKAKSIK